MTIIDRLVNRQKNLSLLYTQPKDGIYFPQGKLITEMLDKLPICVWSNPKLKFCEVDGGSVLSSEIVIRLMNGLEKFKQNEKERYIYIMNNMIYCYTSSAVYFNVSKKLLLLENNEIEHNIYNIDFLDTNNDIKFDVTVGIPQHRVRINVGDNTINLAAVWDDYVIKAFQNTNKEGYVSLIHPCYWRNPSGAFKNIKKLLCSKKMLHLEIHDSNDGQKIFNTYMRYDWYVCQNLDYDGSKTEVRFQDGTIINYDLNDMPFIPNGSLKLIKKLLAKNGDENCNIIHSYSIYNGKKNYVSKNKSNKFKYPVVYLVHTAGDMTLWYSSKNEGHFGIPKLIWSNGAIKSITSVIDNNGKYGLMPFSYAIVDTTENLCHIKKAFDSKRFRNLMGDCELSNGGSRRMMSFFKKDFWKYFVTKTGKEI